MTAGVGCCLSAEQGSQLGIPHITKLVVAKTSVSGHCFLGFELVFLS
mgnify:CR=1 FL=1